MANDQLNSVLNDLVQINNDRVKGYEKAADESKTVDVDLNAMFLKMADDSRRYAAELSQEIKRLGGEPTTDTTNMGKVYRVWMDLKAAFTGHDRHSILEACEFGEDSAQKAYKEALSSDAEISAETRQIITTQQSALKSAHDTVKKYRDMHKAAMS